MPNQVLGIRIPRDNDQDQIIRSGNYCCSSVWVAHTQTTYPNQTALREGKKGARPAEVGALAQVFEKSATELKLKQNY